MSKISKGSWTELRLREGGSTVLKESPGWRQSPETAPPTLPNPKRDPTVWKKERGSNGKRKREGAEGVEPNRREGNGDRSGNIGKSAR